MDSNERCRLFMAHLRQARRALGLCPRCGLCHAPLGHNCDECNRVQRIKREVMVTNLPYQGLAAHPTYTEFSARPPLASSGVSS